MFKLAILSHRFDIYSYINDIYYDMQNELNFAWNESMIKLYLIKNGLAYYT